MSTREVWKVSMRPEPWELVVALPSMAQPLSAQMQNGNISIWFLVDPTRSLVNRNLLVVGTGMPFKSRFHSYIDTVQNGDLVWHVFEVDA